MGILYRQYVMSIYRLRKSGNETQTVRRPFDDGPFSYSGTILYRSEDRDRGLNASFVASVAELGIHSECD